MDLLGGRRAFGNQGGVDAVVLRPLQDEAGVGPHLGRLEYHHDEPLAAQLRHDSPFVAAARLDPDALDPVPAQPARQAGMTGRGVVDLQTLTAGGDRRIELVFAGIDAGAPHARLGHLPRPSLECEPWVPSTIRVR